MEIDTKVLAVHARLIRSGLDEDYAAMQLDRLEEGAWSSDPDAIAKSVLSEAPDKFIDETVGSSFLDRIREGLAAEKEARRNGGTGEAGGGEPDSVYDRIRKQARADREDARTASEKLDDRLAQS